MAALRAIESGEIRSVRFGCSPWASQSLFRAFCSMHKEMLPACTILPTHDDTAHLAEEVLTGIVDAAIVTLPLEHSQLHVEEILRERLVVCLRKDDPLARKSSLKSSDLHGRLSVLYHPRRHPEAHERLLELLEEEGLKVDHYSFASNPFELQILVKEGHGFALVREGSVHVDELTTRPIAGVTWTVDTAVVYREEQHPKTIPILIKNLKRHCKESEEATRSLPANTLSAGSPVRAVMDVPKRASQSVRSGRVTEIGSKVGKRVG